MLGLPPILTPIAGQDKVTNTWMAWLAKLQSFFSSEPMPLASFTVADLPAAGSFTGYIVFVSDESGGAQVAYSDGTNWKRVSDGATVS